MGRQRYRSAAAPVVRSATFNSRASPLTAPLHTHPSRARRREPGSQLPVVDIHMLHELECYPRVPHSLLRAVVCALFRRDTTGHVRMPSTRPASIHG